MTVAAQEERPSSTPRDDPRANRRPSFVGGTKSEPMGSETSFQVVMQIKKVQNNYSQVVNSRKILNMWWLQK